MITEYENEPVPGLPAKLPPGESILWQGAPDWRALAREAFHVRAVAVYFAVLIVWGLAAGNVRGAAITLGLAIAAIVLLHILAWLTARATLYTITERRIVMRFGVALPMCINLPMVAVSAASLNLRDDGNGDIALALTQRQRAGFLMLWPHARPWKLGAPEPMLRALPDAQSVATLLTEAMAAAVPGGQRATATNEAAPMAAAPRAITA